MAQELFEKYHLDRQRHCMDMADQASDPTTRHLHEQLAAEHHRLAIEARQRPGGTSAGQP